MSNYTVYHLHSDYSLLDSTTNYKDYIDKAEELGMNAIAFSEHGRISGWFKKYAYCKEKNIKYIHACEVYLTESLTEKKRDNYHTVLIAKNKAGFKELNTIVSRSFKEDHFYYTNRISFDEFLELSDNIITTSACLASPLNKLDKNNPYYEKLLNRYDFLEIQPHNHPDQKAFNIDLAFMAAEKNKPLIVGTDTHSLNSYKAECRQVLLERKGQSYGDEDTFDLTFKTYDELAEMFKIQNAIPENTYLEAIENTNRLAEMIEDYNLDLGLKYPILYGTREKDHEKLVETINKKFKEKVECGAITKEQVPAFEKAIEEELDVFTKIQMDGFMLSMSEILDWCHNNGIQTGPARGSVAGSRIAYIADIIDLNPETWHTVFSRFANVDRVEVGDIDTDVIESDRPKIFEYVRNRFGKENCARVSAFGTLADKAAIDAIGGVLFDRWIKKQLMTNAPDIYNAVTNPHGYKAAYDKWVTDNPGANIECPWSLAKMKEIKAEWEKDPDVTRTNYPELFYYYDGLVGTKQSQSIHPAGMVISPIALTDNFGTFDKDGDDCLFLDMDECHDLGLVKYDFLCLANVEIIRDTCNAIGMSYPKSYEIDWFDEKVWDDMLKCPYGIFEMESDFAFQLLNKMKPKNIFEMSMITAAIRPSGASYRDDLMARIVHDNGSELINNLLKDNYGYLIYQEDVIKFLQDICGFTGSQADTIRRAIAKKKLDQIEAAMPGIVDGYCAKSDKPREIAEQEAQQFVQILEDASSYMFGYNHSVAYCLIGYICAWLRCYYPHEFITTYLNKADTDEDIRKGTELASVYGIVITPPKYGLSKDVYVYDKEEKVIAKGISSIKYLSDSAANGLYEIAHEDKPETFLDLLYVLKNKKVVNSKQLDILIKIDFFDRFGNQRELFQILKMFDLFKEGECSQIAKDKIITEEIKVIVEKYTSGTNKNGTESKNYKFTTDTGCKECIEECYRLIKSYNMRDLDDRVKIANYRDCLGYVPATGKEEDRKTLIITDVTPLVSKTGKTAGKTWAYRISTSSLGSGKQARLSLNVKLFNEKPLRYNDIIKCEMVHKDDKGYWVLDSYYKI